MQRCSWVAMVACAIVLAFQSSVALSQDMVMAQRDAGQLGRAHAGLESSRDAFEFLTMLAEGSMV